MADLSTPRTSPAAADERPELLIFCGIAGLVGAVVPTALNLVAGTIAQHDFIADTISDLGRGPHKWIMDTGFYISAASLLSLAIGTAHLHLGRLGWSLGIFTLSLAALVTVLLGLWDKFGGTGDMSVHTQLSFLLAPLYLAGPILMARGVAEVSRPMSLSFYASAGLWIVFATAFKLGPDSVDGLLEKLAFLATLFWTVPLSWLLLQRDRGS